MKILALVTPNEITPKYQNEICNFSKFLKKYFEVTSNRCDDFANHGKNSIS